MRPLDWTRWRILIFVHSSLVMEHPIASSTSILVWGLPPGPLLFTRAARNGLLALWCFAWWPGLVSTWASPTLLWQRSHSCGLYFSFTLSSSLLLRRHCPGRDVWRGREKIALLARKLVPRPGFVSAWQFGAIFSGFLGGTKGWRRSGEIWMEDERTDSVGPWMVSLLLVCCWWFIWSCDVASWFGLKFEGSTWSQPPRKPLLAGSDRELNLLIRVPDQWQQLSIDVLFFQLLILQIWILPLPKIHWLCLLGWRLVSSVRANSTRAFQAPSVDFQLPQ